MVTRGYAALEFGQPRGPRTCDLGDLRTVEQALARREPEVKRLVQTVREGGLIDLATHAPAVIAACVQVLAKTDAASIAALLCATPAFAGCDVAQLAAEADRLAQPTHAGGEVSTTGRLAQIDEHVQQLPVRLNLMGRRLEFAGREWQDEDVSVIRRELEAKRVSEPDRPLPRADIEEAVRLRACRYAYHPVTEYLQRIGRHWDGQPRAELLWVRYFGAADSPLHRALGVCFLLGAARRALAPEGRPDFRWWSKVDLMPILLSPQGQYKSTGLKHLAEAACDGAFSDAAWNSSHRAENAMTLSGCWIWEVPELEGLDRSEANAIKAFISRTHDDVLRPYARTKTRELRRSVMVGTTNEAQCLRDPTGNRRHPVIPTGTIDVAAILQDRHQLWAEAVVRAVGPEPHWLSDELAAAQAEANAAHEVPLDEVWTDAVARWLARPPGQHGVAPEPGEAVATGFTLRQCFANALPPQTQQDERRLGRVLARLGVAQLPRTRTGAWRVRRYGFPSG